MTRDLDANARLRAWSHRRQSLGRSGDDPAGALASVIAVYSSHPTAPLSLAARCRSLDGAAFQALERERRAVRLPAMRQSVFLVPTETAGRVLGATRQPISRLSGRLRYAGLDRDGYEALKGPALEAARQPIDASALKGALQGVAGEKVRVLTAVRIMAYEGLILRLSTSLRGDSLEYVATEAWLGEPLSPPDPEEALRWLAETYLDRYGPARPEDFAWWSGASRKLANRAFEQADTVEVGDGLSILEGQRDDFERVEPLDPDQLDVIPKWDPYVMGYAPSHRQRLVEDEHLASAYTTSETKAGATTGDSLPLVLAGGRAIASWSHRFDGDRMSVEVSPFPGESLPGEALEDAFEPVSRVLGASSVRW